MKFIFNRKSNVRSLLAVMVALFSMLWVSLTAMAAEDEGIAVTVMEWKARNSELRIAGTVAGPRQTVSIRDANTDAVLGTTVSRRDGRWTLRKRNLNEAPCMVLVELNDGSSILSGYTKNAPQECSDTTPPEKSLTNLTIGGPAQVDENSTAQYICTAEFSDGSSEVVNAAALWALDPAENAEIAAGLLTAPEIAADMSITILASYELGGISQEASLSVDVIDSPSGPLTGSHAKRITPYEGTATCLQCHTREAEEVHGSVHYQWRGDASETIGLNTAEAGKSGGINDFCIYPDINWIGKLTNTAGLEVDGGCAKCHVGLGQKPATDATSDQLVNIDCLVCHSDSYRRKVDSVNGEFRFVPDTAKMTVSIEQAAADITLPSKDSCLNCHTKAGGGNNFKRGDIEEAHRNPSRGFDVHMASETEGGAGLSCLDCHTALDHRIAGRGTDLRPRELPDEVSCTNCHSNTPHDVSDIDKHTARVNCTVCHIPYFAKIAATDMNRDWSQPGVLVSSRGLYEPAHEKGTNVVPEYRFFNGMSYFYQFGDRAEPGTDGRVVMSAPIGDVHDQGAKIYAFKRHLATQPIGRVQNRLLPLKIGLFFETGVVDEAVAQGAAAVDWTYQGHDFADTERYMGLFHEVAPKGDALTCGSCHDGGTRLNFAALGYAPKSTYNGKSLCAGCHEDESNAWSGSAFFRNVHSKHVNSEGYDCSRCHTFSKAQ